MEKGISGYIACKRIEDEVGDTPAIDTWHEIHLMIVQPLFIKNITINEWNQKKTKMTNIYKVKD